MLLSSAAPMKGPPLGVPERPAGWRAPNSGGSAQQCCCPDESSLAAACAAYCEARRSRLLLSPLCSSLSPSVGLTRTARLACEGPEGVAAAMALGGPPEGFAAALLREQQEAMYSSSKRMPLGRAGEGLNPHQSNDVCCGIKQTPEDLHQAKACLCLEPQPSEEGGGPLQVLAGGGAPAHSLQRLQQRRRDEKASLAAAFAARLSLPPHLSPRTGGPPAWWGFPMEGTPQEQRKGSRRKRGPLELPEGMCFGVLTDKGKDTVADCMQHPYAQQQQQQQQQQPQQQQQQQQQREETVASQKQDLVWGLMHPPSRWEALVGEHLHESSRGGPPQESSRSQHCTKRAPSLTKEELWRLVSNPTPLLPQEQFEAAFAAAVQQQKQQQKQQQEQQQQGNTVSPSCFLAAFNEAVGAQAALAKGGSLNLMREAP
ncbi:hypothetical protein Esti_004520 [Eimeria stiedai]